MEQKVPWTRNQSSGLPLELPQTSPGVPPPMSPTQRATEPSTLGDSEKGFSTQGTGMVKKGLRI